MKVERKIVVHGEVAEYTIFRDCMGSWKLEIENFGESIMVSYSDIYLIIEELTELTKIDLSR